ncbi:excinuclease ABC, C subunit [Winkia neuii]|nr:excinuclease ABC, C subunit [Winkia neuii]
MGKAKNLRARLANYFQDPASLNPRIAQMVRSASQVRWVVVGTEVESLSLEYAWIKEFEPRYNVMYRDDKSYPYLAVTMSEPFPRVEVTRAKHKKGNRYFGPYTKVWAIRETLELLQRPFPVRTCTNGVFNRAKAQGRPCLLGYIDRCSAPCVGRISQEDHRQLAVQLCDFMAGKTGPLIRQLTAQMKDAAQRQEYERAASLRDTLKAAKTVLEKNTVVLEDGTDADIFGLATSELVASVQVFMVRGGRIRGERGWVIERAYQETESELIEKLLEQVYGDYQPSDTPTQRDVGKSVDDRVHTPTSAMPREIWVPALPADSETVTKWLAQKRGGPVRLRQVQRGDKKALAETVEKNAKDELRLHLLRRSGDLTERSKALEELADALELDTAPLRIEGFDISHISGTNQVASMVVFEDGAPRKSAYRHFAIRGKHGEGASDDTAAMAEVLTRRLARLQAEEKGIEGEDEDGIPFEVGPLDEEGSPRRFSYRPDLLVVDGGLPQVNAAARVVADMGADIPVVGLAKRLEEIWIPGEDLPVILPRTSPALFMLQYLRDESHRFAITYHRKKRGKAMTRSVLDKIEGLGPARQKALLKHFGSVARIRAATPEELSEVEGIGPALASKISEKLAR